MISLYKKAGLKDVEFRQNVGEWVVTLWRPEPIDTPQVGPHHGPLDGVHDELNYKEITMLDACKFNPKNRALL